MKRLKAAVIGSGFIGAAHVECVCLLTRTSK